jgi:guanylate kinase
MPSGRVVILSGPSGVGKDTVIDAWREVNPLVRRVVACTTRAPREGETDGMDYTFLSPEEFDRKAAQGEFLEHKVVHGKGYATPRDQVDRLVAEGCIALLKIDVQGALEVREKLPGVLSIFILPPSRDELAARIRGRGTETEEQQARRLKAAEEEMARAGEYTHQVVNDQVEACVQRLQEIVGG